jgi:proteic killer suppression protein
MIRSVRCKETRKLLNREHSRVFQSIEEPARRKLRLLDAAESLNDLARLPGLRLEALKGDRKGQHSIRINDQYRICFVWRDEAAEQVEIVDYH